jgi:uncharacterized membrane protein
MSRKARPAVRATRKSLAAQAAVAPLGATPVARAPARIEGLDALRGIAIVAMIGYHFAFDLRYFGFTRSDFEHDLRWLAARTLILASFLLIAGISAVLAHQGPAPQRWKVHLAKIAAAALVVSVASALMFPRSFIWFGVLHAIAASLVVAQLFVGRPLAAAVVGAAVIAAGLALSHAAFDNRMLGWLGFMTAKPLTEDYVPMFPWSGVLLLGVAAGHWLLRHRFAALSPLAAAPAPLNWMGRHSLALYLVHQPVMLALLWVVARR